MIIKAVEQIKSVLKMGFPTYSIMDYPDDIKKMSYTSSHGCMLVRYDSSTFSAPIATDLIEQKETMEFPVFFSLRYAHSFADIYPFVKNLKNALTGLLIEGYRLYPKKINYVTQINGDIWWSFSFCLDVWSQQKQNLPQMYYLDTPPAFRSLENENA